MTFKRNMSLVVLVLAALFALAGCGGGDDTSASSSSDEAALTKGQFISSAEKICNEAKAQMSEELATFVQKNGQSARVKTEAVEEILVPLLRSQIESIGELPPPSGDEEEVGNYLNALEGSTDEIEEKGLSENADLRAAFRPAGDIAEGYGMHDCAYGY